MTVRSPFATCAGLRGGSLVQLFLDQGWQAFKSKTGAGSAVGTITWVIGDRDKAHEILMVSITIFEARWWLASALPCLSRPPGWSTGFACSFCKKKVDRKELQSKGKHQ